MTNPIHPMNVHGYCFPSPPRPASPDLEHMLQDEREYKYMTKVQAAHDNKDEDIPAPYCYHVIIAPDSERDALKERFMQSCNQRRWQHIHNAEVKVKK